MLGDQRQPGCLERGAKRPHRIAFEPLRAGPLELALADHPAAAVDVRARGLEDPVELAHQRGASSRVRATKRSSNDATAPESIAASAARTPSSSDSASFAA